MYDFSHIYLFKNLHICIVSTKLSFKYFVGYYRCNLNFVVSTNMEQASQPVNLQLTRLLVNRHGSYAFPEENCEKRPE